VNGEILGGDRADEPVQTGMEDADCRMPGRPVANLPELPARGAAAVIAESVETGDVRELVSRGAGHAEVEARGHFVVFRQVIPIGRPVGHHAATAHAFPNKGRGGEVTLRFAGAREDKAAHAGSSEDVRQTAAVAEGIRRPRDARDAAKALLKVMLSAGEVAQKCLGGREVGVGLDVRAADDLPAPGADGALDAAEGDRVVLFDVLIHGGFAADESEVGKFVHEIEHGAAGGDAFVETFAPIPEPDRVEVGVGDEVDGEGSRGRWHEANG